MKTDYSGKGEKEFYKYVKDKEEEINSFPIPKEEKEKWLEEVKKTIETYEYNKRNYLRGKINLIRKRLIENNNQEIKNNLENISNNLGVLKSQSTKDKRYFIDPKNNYSPSKN